MPRRPRLEAATMRRGTGTTIVLLVLSDDGLSNTVASIVMLQSLVLFPDRFFFVQSQEKETVLVFVLPLLCGIFYHELGPSIWYSCNNITTTLIQISCLLYFG